jgi:hypothetical protein
MLSLLWLRACGFGPFERAEEVKLTILPFEPTDKTATLAKVGPNTHARIILRDGDNLKEAEESARTCSSS